MTLIHSPLLRLAGLCLVVLLVALPVSGQRLGQQQPVDRAQKGSQPTLRVIDETPGSVTFEARAQWRGRLVDARHDDDLTATILAAVDGLPWVSDRILLRSLAQPQVTILSSEIDEVSWGGDLEHAEEAEIVGPPVEVQRVGMDRRRPMGTVVVRMLHVDSEGQRLRRINRIRFRVDLPQTAPRGAPDNPHLDVTESVLAAGTWFKVPVSQEGIYRIDRAFLSDLGLNPNSIDPNQVKVYGNSGAPLPALNSDPRIPDLTENRVMVVGGGDGRFDDGDAVYFFGRASSGWEWAPAPNQNPVYHWRHYKNPYSRLNHYFIRVDGPASTQLSQAAVPSGTAVSRSQLPGRIFREEDRPEGMIDRDGGGSGLDWLGMDVTQARPRVTILDTIPANIAEGTVYYRSRVALRSNASRSLSWMSGSTGLATQSLSASTTSTLFTHATRQFTQPASSGQRLQMDLVLNQGSGTATGWIDYIQAFYPMDLRATADFLRFAVPADELGTFDLQLTGFSSTPEVWDVTEVGRSQRLPVESAGGSHNVRVRIDDPEHPVELVAFQPNSSRILSLDGEAAEPVANQNLHGFAGNPEYVIITHSSLREAADELAEYRSPELSTAVFDIDEIYNEFSGGQLDPRGMRDFIRFLYDRSPGPEPSLRYVLLFGDGNFDYRGIRPGGLENNLIPTYQTENSNSYSGSYTSDDYFGLLDADEGLWGDHERVDIGIGRLPVRTLQEAHEMVHKIRRYESPETQGAWRTRYTLLSDDHRPNAWDRDLHVQNSELLADTVHAHVPAANIEKIYMGSYTLQQTALGARYPAATADALRSLNEGTLVWNYSGHGGPSALADEKLVEREDLVALTNLDRLTVAITATCSFGRYDLADERSGGEMFVLNPHGGAVAIFTTVRVVFAGQNPAGQNSIGVNTTLNRMLLSLDDDGRARRLGDANRLAKGTAIASGTNGRKFNLLGDPALRFGLPERPVEVTSVNDIDLGREYADDRIDLTADLPTAHRATSEVSVSETSVRQAVPLEASATTSARGSMPELRAQEMATIRGRVLDLGGQFDPSFGGEVEVMVYDVARTHTLPPETCEIGAGCYTDLTYEARSDLIYRGRASVQNGEWEARFIVPRDISYAGGTARIAAYVSSSSGLDGQGFSEEVRIGTESGAPLDDNQGPEMRLFLNDTTFVSGGLTGDEPIFIARLSDESGINMAGVGVGHEMLLVINGNEAEGVDVGPFYRSDLDTFRSGEVRYPLPELGDGPHTLSLTAWDVVNNSATSTLDFLIEADDRLRIEHAYPYPNPTTGPTRFVFEHNQPPGTPAAVQIRIYTISGRPIRTLDGPMTLPEGVLTGSPVQIPWDGRDEDMDELATGVYLYRVRVEVDRGDGERRVTERIERLAIIR